MGLSEGHLGPVLCRFGALLDCPEALSDDCGAIWSLPGGFGRPEDRRLGTSGSRKEENPKNQQKINDFCLLGPSW
eukprot:2163541-Pyramimonas_sp.AAC.1